LKQTTKQANKNPTWFSVLFSAHRVECCEEWWENNWNYIHLRLLLRTADCFLIAAVLIV